MKKQQQHSERRSRGSEQVEDLRGGGMNRLHGTARFQASLIMRTVANDGFKVIHHAKTAGELTHKSGVSIGVGRQAWQAAERHVKAGGRYEVVGFDEVKNGVVVLVNVPQADRGVYFVFTMSEHEPGKAVVVTIWPRLNRFNTAGYEAEQFNDANESEAERAAFNVWHAFKANRTKNEWRMSQDELKASKREQARLLDEAMTEKKVRVLSNLGLIGK